jgi:hypothetical protein
MQGECAAPYFEDAGNIDVVELLPQVRAPTLVMPARGDLQVPIEVGLDRPASKKRPMCGKRTSVFEG